MIGELVYAHCTFCKHCECQTQSKANTIPKASSVGRLLVMQWCAHSLYKLSQLSSSSGIFIPTSITNSSRFCTWSELVHIITPVSELYQGCRYRRTPCPMSDPISILQNMNRGIVCICFALIQRVVWLDFFVYKRPHVDYFLNAVSEIIHLHVFNIRSFILKELNKCDAGSTC